MNTVADTWEPCAGGSDPPRMHWLSNGRYHVMVTSAGAGTSRWQDLAVTRWHEDARRNGGGSFCFVHDGDGGHKGSTTPEPMGSATARFEFAFSPGMARFRSRQADIETQNDIVVSPDDDVEVRRLRITSHAAVRRTLTVTSYAEIVLEAPAADDVHPAFEKLFVETAILADLRAIVCARRPRAPAEPRSSMFHLLAAPGLAEAEVSFETDRMRFIGRGRSAADPLALDGDAPLSGSAGAVLDPVVAIRFRLTLEPGHSFSVDLVSGFAASREAADALARKWTDPQLATGALVAAGPFARAALKKLHAGEADARLFMRLAASLVCAGPALRAAADVVAANRQGQPGLWGLSISGDLPIALLRVGAPRQIDVVSRIVQAHAFWRLHGLAVDLVILCDDDAGARPDLVAPILALLAASADAGLADRPGGIFVRAAGAIPDATRTLLQAVARVVIDADDGPLAEQVERRCAVPPAQLRADADIGDARGPEARSEPTDAARTGPAAEPTPRELVYPNGLGGFTPDGREYAVTVSRRHMTPVPWVNVLANPSFGTLVSESGSAGSWSENAQTFRLTPWSNDPVEDPNTEAFYIRDEDSGRYGSPTLLPSPDDGAYVARHGFGYSVFEHSAEGIDSELSLFVAIDAPIKFAVLRLRNTSPRERRLSVTGYVEWVLGEVRAKSAMHVCTSIDPASGAIFASNPYSQDFGTRVAFFDVDAAADRAVSVCGDRLEFLGPDGSLQHPAAMAVPRLSGRVGAALDPCAAIRVPVTLTPGQSHEIVFRLGAGATQAEARALVLQGRGPAAVCEARAAVGQHWGRTLGAVQVHTPDRSLDLLANGWLLYQTLACRLWARHAFYQSSGAFGFRDQLQDVMALVHAAPQRVREHLLLCASRQFAEGDVQHWWHPPAGRGVRTHCSDDYLWLPFALCRYVGVTGDTGVLDEPVPYLAGTALEDHAASSYELPTRSDQVGSLYEHAVRAIDHGLRFGAHGLPLMGTGDWNDGMNLVGAAGKGESVWLGFFLCAVLGSFADLARQRGDAALAQRCEAVSTRLRGAIDASAWDGAWYRRAWFDDGSPLGTSGNAECRIASIAQSWSVLSGAGDVRRACLAMDAVDTHLVRRDAALIQLLDPPFEHSDPSPGYIQGYVQGVRENGGQYTHAAVWSAMAFAALGDAPRAWELFTMLDPVRHANSAAAIATYLTEPYVIASDVYALPPHRGRGGWTWYTGSAGWMLRFIVESLLGLRVEADRLRIEPCVPADWPSFGIDYRYRETLYRIEVRREPPADGASAITVDGLAVSGPALPLVDDRREHAVVFRIPATGT